MLIAYAKYLAYSCISMSMLRRVWYSCSFHSALLSSHGSSSAQRNMRQLVSGGGSRKVVICRIHLHECFNLIIHERNVLHHGEDYVSDKSLIAQDNSTRHSAVQK